MEKIHALKKLNKTPQYKNNDNFLKYDIKTSIVQSKIKKYLFDKNSEFKEDEKYELTEAIFNKYFYGMTLMNEKI